jgi:hypothetical protein
MGSGQPGGEGGIPRRAPGWKTVGVVLAVAVAAVLVLREAGAVNLDFYVAKSKASVNSTVVTSRVTSGGEEVPLAEFAFVPKVTTRSGSAVAKAAGDALRRMKTPRETFATGRLTVDVTAVGLKGHYLLPLWKTGRCEFTARYELDAERGRSSVTVNGTVEGSIDSTVKGICSVRTFNRIVGRELAAEVEKQITKQREAKT